MMKNLIHNKPLKDLCTFGIGGPAKLYVEVRTVDEMREAMIFSRNENFPFFILGKGSNCLFDDRGFNGLVINNKIDFMENPEPGLFKAGAGYSFSLLGVQTARQHWSGLEFASGIPCSVGGAVFMNAGANGSETCQHLISVEFVDQNGDLQHFKKENLHFGYRTSSFQQMKGAIVSATFKLDKKDTARDKQLEIVAYRTKTQPYGEKSAGCVFRNPPSQPAGALIDRAGLKGQSLGGASISHKHANFIVNQAEASAKDVAALIALTKNQVKSETGIDLEVEIRIIPFDFRGDIV